MATLTDGTPIAEQQVVRFNELPYYVLTPDQAKQVAGGRHWRVTLVPAQDAKAEEHAIHMDTYHEGSGFTYSGLPGVYDYADGWDASSPGRITTWPVLATGATTTLGAVPPKGWIFDTGGGYFYVARGRYVSKYQSVTTGATMSKVVADHDLGASNVCAGRPAQFGGAWYIPVENASGVNQVFAQLAPGGAGADTWASGPAGAEAQCFATWNNLLVRANSNSVYTVSASPMTFANWSAGSNVVTVDNSAYPITDLYNYDRYVVVRTSRGYWTFDQNLKTVNELPDLQRVTSTVASAGMDYSNGYEIIPHASSLVRWRPQAWEAIGPEQEHALEGDVSQGWGTTAEVLSYGPKFFTAQNDSFHGTGAILSYGPGRGQRGPLIPHCHHQTAGTFEALGLVMNSDGVTPILVALAVDATGLICTPTTWQLPRAGMHAADDPNVLKKAAGKTFFTSRYPEPGRDIQKTYHKFEGWLDANPTTNTPGFQVWASVDGGSFFQLLDGAGAAATVLTTGPIRLYFPKTSSAVGHYCQLKYVVPTLTGGQVVAQYTLRDSVLWIQTRPLTTTAVDAMVSLAQVRLANGTTDRRTMQQMEADLIALCGQNASPPTYNGPNGETGIVEVKGVVINEVLFKEGSRPVKVAQVSFEVKSYGNS